MHVHQAICMKIPGPSREVWAQNLKEEVRNMSYAAESFSYIAVEAHVPAVVASPTGPFGTLAMQFSQKLYLS